MKKILFFSVISCFVQVQAQTFRTNTNKILDPCLVEFIPRGVNYSLADDWNFPANLNDGRERSSQIIQANPNVVRIQWYVNYGSPSRPALTLVGLDSVITRFERANIVTILELHDFTHIHTDTTAFNNQIINWWTNPQVLQLIENHKSHLLVNIANEYGPSLYPAPNYTLNPNYASQITTWVTHYKSCISYLRNAGIDVPIIIDAPNYGMDYQTVIDNAAVFNNHDPLNNIIMSCHGYWNSNAAGMETIINQLSALTVPVILGEIGNVDFACSPIEMNALLTAATTNDIGWLAWTWNRDECAVRNMTNNNTNGSSTTDGTFASLSTYGNTIVNDPNFGLAAKAIKASWTCSSGLNSIKKELEFSVYPNPANEIALIQFEYLPENTRVIITDQIGKNKAVFEINSQQTIIDVSNWSTGIYYIKLESNKNFEIKKFVVL